MRRILIVLLFLITSSSTVLNAQDWSSPEVEQMYTHGMNTLGRGNAREALAIFQRLDPLEPNNFLIKKALVQSYQLSGEHASALLIFNELLQQGKADAECYRVAAQAHSGLKDDKKALKTLQDGLVLFPDKGVLYYDLGLQYKGQKNYELALKYWIDGIRNDPNFHLNYYEAAIAYVQTDDVIWAILYGEIFVNKESQTKRSAEVRTLILDAYQKLFFTPVKQGKINTLAIEGVPASFEEAVRKVYLSLFFVVNDGINTENLIMLRTRFAIQWTSLYAQKYPFSLFEYHDEMLRNGNFEPYNQWLFGKIENPVQYESWISSFKEKMQRFENFRARNPLRLRDSDGYNNRKSFKGFFPENITKGAKR